MHQPRPLITVLRQLKLKPNLSGIVRRSKGLKPTRQGAETDPKTTNQNREKAQ